ncbi:MAG TPA: hypothetical protein VFZ66_08025 [Herpetosiphonaceae bacterium]
MKRVRLWSIAVGCLLVLGLSFWAVVQPLAQAVEGPPPPLGESRVTLESGHVVRQTLALPQPVPGDIAPRIWIQRVLLEQARLTVRAEAVGQTLGQTSVRLPVPDQSFHVLQLPWWHIPAGARSVTLTIEGNGVVLLATAVDRVAGGDLEIDGVSHAPGDLALQIVSSDRGIERYVPLSAAAAQKPGVLGWPRLVLLVIAAFVIGGMLLIGSAARLARLVEGAQPSAEGDA